MKRKLKKINLLLLYFAFLSLAKSQNLIPDSSFESNKFIPLDYSLIGANGSWSSPSRATTDLFCACKKKDAKLSRVNVPNNGMGTQEAHSGKCYAGIFACSHGYYREYLQTSLNAPLESNKEYVLSFFISLADYSSLAVDRLGVSFIKGDVKYEHSDIITNLHPIYIPMEDEVGMDVNEWHQLLVHFKAKGGENKLILGGFGIKRLWRTGNAPPREVSSPINRKYERDAYYYIDDVSLFEFKPEVIDTTETPWPFTYSEVPDTVVVEPVTIDKVPSDVLTVFKNLLFQSGESVLSKSSYSELDVIASYLKVDPKLNIEIYGHTDNAGDEKKNVELSANRAKAVGDYLIAKGVNVTQVKFEGFGSSKPIDSNASEEGRKMNRRVEFIMKK